VTLPCGHTFDRACIARWLKQKCSCPLGRCSTACLECAQSPARLAPRLTAYSVATIGTNTVIKETVAKLLLRCRHGVREGERGAWVAVSALCAALPLSAQEWSLSLFSALCSAPPSALTPARARRTLWAAR